MPDQLPTIYIDFPIENLSGWGNYGFNLVKYATMRGVKVRSVVAQKTNIDILPLFDQEAVKSVVEQSKTIVEHIDKGGVIEDKNGIFLTHMKWSENLRQSLDGLKVGRQFGVVFYEYLLKGYNNASKIDPDAYEAVICGSSWNAQHLRKAGYKKAITILQGVNSNHYFPRIAPLVNDGKFYIFSGGKLEIRKGQDIVFEAFKLIQDKIPNAILVAGWHWVMEAALAKQFNNIKVAHVPWVIEKKEKDVEVVNMMQTAINYGIDANRVISLKMMPSHRMAQIMQQCHMAVFPNRAEGGTNLVAMEAIATGLPSVVGYNTGQKDLFKICPDLHEIGLTSDTNIRVLDPETKENTTNEWGFHNPNEVADRILQIYNNYDHYQQLGKKMAVQMTAFSWERQINLLLDYVIDGKQPIHKGLKLK